MPSLGTSCCIVTTLCPCLSVAQQRCHLITCSDADAHCTGKKSSVVTIWKPNLSNEIKLLLESYELTVKGLQEIAALRCKEGCKIVKT